MGMLGIGGLFVRARDPEALRAWHRAHLGVGNGCAGEGAGPPAEWGWQALGGPVLFAPLLQDSDYFPADRGHMLNLRVSGLPATIAALRAARIEVVTSPEWDQPDVGRLARIHDPEGNPIELWEPSA